MKEVDVILNNVPAKIILEEGKEPIAVLSHRELAKAEVTYIFLDETNPQ